MNSSNPTPANQAEVRQMIDQIQPKQTIMHLLWGAKLSLDGIWNTKRATLDDIQAVLVEQNCLISAPYDDMTGIALIQSAIEVEKNALRSRELLQADLKYISNWCRLSEKWYKQFYRQYVKDVYSFEQKFTLALRNEACDRLFKLAEDARLVADVQQIILAVTEKRAIDVSLFKFPYNIDLTFMSKTYSNVSSAAPRGPIEKFEELSEAKFLKLHGVSHAENKA